MLMKGQPFENMVKDYEPSPTKLVDLPLCHNNNKYFVSVDHSNTSWSLPEPQ